MIFQDIRKLCAVVLPPFVVAFAFKVLNLFIFDLAMCEPFPFILVLIGEVIAMMYLSTLLYGILGSGNVDNKLFFVLYRIFPVANAAVSLLSVSMQW